MAPRWSWARGGWATVPVAAVMLVLALAHLLLGLAPPPPPSYHGFRSRYSFDADRTSNAAWMAALPDATDLRLLSIPGTHDTLTHDLSSDQVHQCQNVGLAAQLRAGVRYVDVRARRTPAGLAIFHGSIYTGYTYADVLLTLFAFLDAHPTEAIVMRLKEEGPPTRLPPGASPSSSSSSGGFATFVDAFNHYRWNDSRTAAGCARHLHLGNETALPLGRARGKIQVLQNFPSARGDGASYGIPWSSPALRIEDMWIIPDIPHLDDKWAAVQESFAAAGRSARDGGDDVPLYLTHLSASVGVLPIEAAAGPLDESAPGINARAGAWLEPSPPPQGRGAVGIVIADFPGRKLIASILRRNAWLMSQPALR